MTTEMKKLCKDCTHCRPWLGFVLDVAQCAAPEAYTKIDLIDGTKAREIKYCQTHRSTRADSDACGKEGQWFVQRKPLWWRFVQIFKSA